MKPHFNQPSVVVDSVQTKWVALVGNPNSGKTAIFNLLTGLNQKVANYPGITVEKKVGTVQFEDGDFRLLDLPGTYSLTAESFDEEIVSEVVNQWAKNIDPPSVIISVVDATNLARNLYLTSQLLDLNIPVVVALNMMDQLDQHHKIDDKKLSAELGLDAVVPLSAKLNEGLDNLKDAVTIAMDSEKNSFKEPPWLNQDLQLDISPKIDEDYFSNRFGIAQALRDLSRSGKVEPGIEAVQRYRWIDDIINRVTKRDTPSSVGVSRSERWDQILTHRWAGPAIFISILYFIFQSIFTWATAPMDWIQLGINNISNFVLNQIS